MKAYKYFKDIEDLLELTHNIRIRISELFTIYRSTDNISAKKVREKINSRHFKKDCEKIVKKTDKIIKHVHKLGQADNLDYLSLIFCIVYLNKLNPPRIQLINQSKLLCRGYSLNQDLKNKLKKDNERMCSAIENVVNKLNALNAEHTGIKLHFQKTIQELAFKMSKREAETLNIEKFETVKVGGEEKEVIGFKGKINAKILFSILDERGPLDFVRMNPERKNSKGKLDARFKMEDAPAIRLVTRYTKLYNPLELLGTDRSAGDDAGSKKVEFLIPPTDIVKQFKIKSFDAYQQLIKDTTLESIKKVFENNSKFFYGYYGKHFNINLNIFLVLSKYKLPLAYVRARKTILSGIGQTPTGPELVVKSICAPDPYNVEIYISMEYIAECVMKNDFKEIELAILHELTHWFTKHGDQDQEPLSKLFLEGIAVFSEYSHDRTEATLKKWFSKNNIEEILRITNSPLSIEEMKKYVNNKGEPENPYFLGLYMWLTIYAYKRQGKDGKKCFEHGINTNRLLEIADETAIKWLMKFRDVMTLHRFFKEYVEATKKMNVPSIFNAAAREFLIVGSILEVAKRKTAIERTRLMRRLGQTLIKKILEDVKERRARK